MLRGAPGTLATSARSARAAAPPEPVRPPAPAAEASPPIRGRAEPESEPPSASTSDTGPWARPPAPIDGEAEPARDEAEPGEAPARVAESAERTSLESLVYERLSAYAESLQGHLPEDMYRLIMPQLERPLIQLALEIAGGERQRAAKMLGIHRNTLRARMRELGLDEGQGRRRPR